MPSKKEWEEAFARWDRGESSLRDEAKRLGVDAATVLRRRLKDLESMIQLRRGELTDLGDAVAGTKRELEGLTEKYDKKRQAEETKLRETLGKREQESKRRLDRINTELEAKEKLIPEAAKRGLTLEQYLEIVKRVPDLDAEVSRKEGISKQWDGAISKKQNRSNELDRQNKEKEGRLGELTAKLGLGGRLLQTRNTENQQLEEELSRKSTTLSQLLDRIKELGDVKSKLNAEVRELGEKRDVLEKQNADLKKALDAERVSLEEGNATLRKANSEMEDTLNSCLQRIQKILEAEKRREAQWNAEFERRKKEADEDLEKRKMEADEEIRKYREACKKIVDEEVKRETAERMAKSVKELERLNKACERRTDQQEKLRIQNIALATQLGETSAAVVLRKKKRE